MTAKELYDNTCSLQKRINNIVAVLDMDTKKQNIVTLEKQSLKNGFWDDAKKAGTIMKELEMLKREHSLSSGLKQRVDDLVEMTKELNDNDVEIYKEEYSCLQKDVTQTEQTILLNGKYDTHNAIITIYAGAGGTDAQDWAEMLLRMYLRWAEKKEYTSLIISESRGTETGYKSVTFEIEAPQAYGLLRTEMGTHRLVRLSPFNSDNLRQTSFARVEIMPVLEKSDTEITINPQDLRIDTFRSQGAGGQSVNTTDSAVRITHITTNTVASCQNERSQLQNKEHAMKILRARLLQKKMQEDAEKQAKLRGEDISAEWGSQIRSYVLHPYKMVKDHRTKYETPQTQDVLNGKIDKFIESSLRWQAKKEHGIIKHI